jgi:hypothetical protein
VSDTLENGLRELSASLQVPQPSAGLADVVLGRVATTAPRRRSRVRWAVVAAIVVALLGLAVSPVGARVVEWLDFHGLMVHNEGGVPSGTPVVPSEPPGTSAGAAFRPLVPTELGPPDGIRVSSDGGRVSMTWSDSAGTIRLDQFDAELDPYFWKSSPVAEHVDVAGRDALWFPEPHAVVVVPEGGTPATHAPRLAGQTLVVPWNGVTMRLEGSFDLDRALEIISSLE